MIIHHRNTRALAIDIYKVIQRISPPLLNEMFVPSQCSYDLRENNFLGRRRVIAVIAVRYSTKPYHS